MRQRPNYWRGIFSTCRVDVLRHGQRAFHPHACTRRQTLPQKSYGTPGAASSGRDRVIISQHNKRVSNRINARRYSGASSVSSLTLFFWGFFFILVFRRAGRRDKHFQARRKDTRRTPGKNICFFSRNNLSQDCEVDIFSVEPRLRKPCQPLQKSIVKVKDFFYYCASWKSAQTEDVDAFEPYVTLCVKEWKEKRNEAPQAYWKMFHLCTRF